MDILDLISGLAAGFPAYTGATHFVLCHGVVAKENKSHSASFDRSNTGGRTYLSLLSPPKSKINAEDIKAGNTKLFTQ